MAQGVLGCRSHSRPQTLLRSVPRRTIVARAASYPESLLSSIASGLLAPYWERCPAATAALDEVDNWLPETTVGFDHFAFRSFGLPHVGIAAVARWFEDLGYTEGGVLEFEKKKLRARWYCPPAPDLPRIFISELKIEEVSPTAQEIIGRYAAGPHAETLGRYGLATGFLGVTPWIRPPWRSTRLLRKKVSTLRGF